MHSYDTNSWLRLSQYLLNCMLHIEFKQEGSFVTATLNDIEGT